MSDPTSIFNSDQTQTTAQQTTPQPNDLSHLLLDIKNERGEQKYRTVEDALNALKHSQAYIPELSEKLNKQALELEEAKKAAEKVSELERVVKALTEQKTPTDDTPSKNDLTPDKVAELVSTVLEQKEQKRTTEQNIQSVVQTVKQAFGDKADEVFYSKAAELGISAEQFNTMAATSPKVVLKLLGIDGVKQVSTAPDISSSINTTGFEKQTDSFISANKVGTKVGATFYELQAESQNAKKMVEEIHAKGMSVHDLTDPKVYFKHFK